MNPYGAVLWSLWTAWLAYWWISSRRSKANRRRESFTSRASHGLPLIVAAVLIVHRPLAFLAARVLPANLPVFVAGTAVVAIGLLFCVWARVHLGTNWSALVTVKQGHELVRSGPYRLVRHPIYTGLLLALLGTAVARGDVQGFVAVAIAAAAFWHKLRIEERWMQETFGDAYARYRAEVPPLVPFVS
jgi:protein-S-isoprenylcysteine O-methyltransferase Ste14